MNLFFKYLCYVLVLTTALTVRGIVVLPVHAAFDDDLSRTIENKEAEIDVLERKIKEYQGRINQFEQTERSLVNQLAILDNKIKKTELDIQQNELEVSKAELEIQRVGQAIEANRREMEETKRMAAEVLRRIYIADEATTLEILLANDVLSDFFDQVRYLESLQSDLGDTVERIQALAEQLQENERLEQERRDRLVTMRDDLTAAKQRLEDEVSAKDVLLSQTQQSETEFSVLLQDLRAEQQYISAELFTLQERLKTRLAETDTEGSGDLVLSWPVANPRITARFHDPSYPFRHLFEHSGLDMAVPQGSPVYAAAPGYVAFVRQGRSYGNYWMIVHRDGVATLGAHMSQIVVAPDQFVERGTLIGYTGGMPGTPGAGLSTGPHLHFEVRQNGIPQDPMGYLVR